MRISTRSRDCKAWPEKGPAQDKGENGAMIAFWEKQLVLRKSPPTALRAGYLGPKDESNLPGSDSSI
jgi:hypothetical protein